MLDPIPRRYTVCSHLFLPRCHRPSPNRDGSAARVCPTNYDFSWRAILEVADIPLCSGLQVCSPPRSFLPLRILPQGSRGFSIRAYRALLPPHAPGMLTVRTQVIDGTGTYTLSDSQPCRLLTSLHGLRRGQALFVRPLLRYYDPVRILIRVHVHRSAVAFMNRPGLPVRARMRLPRFRAKNFSTCARSPTARGSSHASHFAMGRCCLLFNGM